MTPKDSNFTLQTAAIPLSGFTAILVMLVGWWVNTQDGKIADSVQDIRDLSAKVATLELNTNGLIAEIKTTQAVNGQKLEQLNSSIQRLLNRGDPPQ